ncbi:hypothetical protein [Nocardioides sp. BYT-33-1]|uniref:hypothetical protein n=1 Tax=Nocardioides sp. BYT-33-1 TaxID=3416952 RepID=UPI003F53D55D
MPDPIRDAALVVAIALTVYAAVCALLLLAAQVAGVRRRVEWRWPLALATVVWVAWVVSR